MTPLNVLWLIIAAALLAPLVSYGVCKFGRWGYLYADYRFNKLHHNKEFDDGKTG